MDQQTSAQKKNKELQNFIKKEENGIHDRKQASGKVIIREYKPECEQRIKQLETELEQRNREKDKVVLLQYECNYSKTKIKNKINLNEEKNKSLMKEIKVMKEKEIEALNMNHN